MCLVLAVYRRGRLLTFCSFCISGWDEEINWFNVCRPPIRLPTNQGTKAIIKLYKVLLQQQMLLFLLARVLLPPD